MGERRERREARYNVLHLHDLSKAALAYHLEELKVVDCEAILSILDKVDANLHGARAELDGDPFCAGLADGVFFGLFVCPLLFEARVDLEGSDENVLVSAGCGGGGRVANVERHGHVGDAGHIELVLGVATSPQRVLGRAGDGIDEDLLLVEIDQGVGQMLRGVSAVDGGRGVDAAGSGLGAGAIGADDGVPR